MSRAVRLLAVAALVLGPSAALAPAAHAAGSITSPGGGTLFESETAVRLEARVEARSAATEMRLVDPAGTARTVASAGTSLSAQTLSHVFDTACPEYPGSSCSGRQPARNGTWTVQLTGGASDSRGFVLRVPPRAPAEVRAEATGPREVVVTWQRGAEPDLRGYEVVGADGRALAAGDTSCPGGTCRTVLTYATDGPAEETVAVRALRATCPDCDGTLTATSAAVSASRPAPAPDAGSGTPDGSGSGGATPGSEASPGTGGGGTGGSGTGGGGTDGSGTDGSGTGGAGTGGGGTGGGGTGGGGTDGSGTGGTGGTGTDGSGTDGTGGATGGTGPGSAGGTGSGSGGAGPGTTSGTGPGIPVTTTQQDADAFALTFKAFGPKIGLPKLPPLPATGVALPAVAPAEDGGFAGELPFGTTVVEERVPSFVAAPAQRLSGAVSAAVDSERLMRSVAAALVLLLVCAHVRRWLAQSPTEQP